MKHLKSFLGSIYVNSLPPYVGKRIVVFESDDWGTECISDNRKFEFLKRKGLLVEADPYCKYDNIASSNDLENLFDLLLSFKDIEGNSPILTANTNMANPDYQKIKQSQFQEYHYLSVAETLKQYSKEKDLLGIWKKGIHEGVFIPQLHGREHINVKPWLKALQHNDEVSLAFDQQVVCVPFRMKVGNRHDFRAALDYEYIDELDFHITALKDSFYEFERIFGYKSSTFIAPCYTWDTFHENVLNDLGINTFQSGNSQKVPMGFGNAYKIRRRKIGQLNHNGQKYLVRNASFEPSLTHLDMGNLIDSCINSISLAFHLGKPAVISSHRINFIGSRSLTNRDRNLNGFKNLLGRIKAKFPDVLFKSSNQIYG